MLQLLDLGVREFRSVERSESDLDTLKAELVHVIEITPYLRYCTRY